jgi:primosomal replication protein N
VNKFQIDGEIIFEDKIRHTPAGLTVQRFKIEHRSLQKEANLHKQVDVEVDAIFINKQLRKEIQSGKKGLFIGFMDKKSFKSTQLIFHVTEIKF